MPARPIFRDPPVLCGHRGSGRGVVDGRRENTIGSFRAAVRAGLRWVEVDARRTADDVLVASHDPVVADGRFISELPARETDALGLARVADVLADLPPEIGVDLEVKSSLEDALLDRGATTAALAAELAGPEGERRTLLVTSFDASVLPIVRERAPELPIGLITWGRFPLRKAIPAAVHLGAEVLAAHFGSFPLGDSPLARVEREAARSVAVAHEAGLEVATWCPGRAEAERLVEAGVDCLVVDHDVIAAPPRGAGARSRR